MRHIQLASGYLTAVQSIDYLGGSCTRAGEMLEAVTLDLHAWKTTWKKITRETTTDGKTPVCVGGGGGVEAFAASGQTIRAVTKHGVPMSIQVFCGALPHCGETNPHTVTVFPPSWFHYVQCSYVL